MRETCKRLEQLRDRYEKELVQADEGWKRPTTQDECKNETLELFESLEPLEPLEQLETRKVVLQTIEWVEAVDKVFNAPRLSTLHVLVEVRNIGDKSRFGGKMWDMSTEWFSILFHEYATKARDILVSHLAQVQRTLDSKRTLSKSAMKRWRRRCRDKLVPHQQIGLKVLSTLLKLIQQIENFSIEDMIHCNKHSDRMIGHLHRDGLVGEDADLSEVEALPTVRLAVFLWKRAGPLDREMVRVWWNTKTPKFTPQCCIPPVVTHRMMLAQLWENRIYNNLNAKALQEIWDFNTAPHTAFVTAVEDPYNMDHMAARVWLELTHKWEEGDDGLRYHEWRHAQIQCT